MQDIKDSLKMTKSEKMIGKTHGTICVDLSVYMDYLQIQTQEVEKSNERWSYTNRKSRLIEIIVDDLFL